MAEIRLLAIASLLSGCLAIKDQSSYFNPDYEGAIPGLLRPGSEVLYEADAGFPKDPVIQPFDNWDGTAWIRVDPYRWDLDQAWNHLLNNHAVTVGVSGGALTVQVDAFQWDQLSSLASDGYVSSVFCNAELEVRVSVEIATGFRSGLATLGPAPGACAGVLLGTDPDPDAQVVWLGDRAEQLAFTPPADVGDVAIDRTPLPTPDGVPAEVIWVASEAPGELSLAGQSADGAWVFTSTSTGPLSTTEITGPPLGLKPVARVEAATLEVLTTTGRYQWEVGGSGAVTALDSYPAPDVLDDWRGGPWPGGALAVERAQHPEVDDADLLVEVGVQALIDDGGTVSPVDVPLTACTEDADCLALGEWYVVGLYQGPDQWYAVYKYFSWWFDVNRSEVYAVYLAPL